MTPRALILQALRKSGVVGVGQPAQQADLADAFTDLNGMLGQWARRRWLVPHLIDLTFGPTGQTSYSVGAGGDINTPRPDRVVAAFVRYQWSARNPIDYPIEIIQAREDWNAVTLKSWSGVPVALFYDSGYPLGSLYLWPNQGATGATQVHLTLKSNDLAAIASLDTAIPLPPEYDEALIYNLAARLRVSYQLPPDPAVISLAASSLATIRTANTQIPLARMPAGLPGMGRGWAGGSLLPAAGAPSSPKPFQLDGISLLDGPDGLL